jgi:hypothetical protein
MWLCLNKGFYSIVHDKLDPTRTRLVVRARRKGDISKLFPDAEIIPDVGTDYKFRAFITRKDVADRFAKEIPARMTKSCTMPT